MENISFSYPLFDAQWISAMLMMTYPPMSLSVSALTFLRSVYS